MEIHPAAAVADAGFWNEDQMDEVTANKHIQVLIRPTPATVVLRGPAGAAGDTHGCVTCSPRS